MVGTVALIVGSIKPGARSSVNRCAKRSVGPDHFIGLAQARCIHNLKRSGLARTASPAVRCSNYGLGAKDQISFNTCTRTAHRKFVAV